MLTVTSVAVTDIGKAGVRQRRQRLHAHPVDQQPHRRVVGVYGTNLAVVDFGFLERNGFGNGGIAELTDNTTGTASDTLVRSSDAATKNAVARWQAKVNAILRQM